MATAGPRFPGTTANLANAGTSENAEAWVNPGNIVSDNATEAQITAATYDSPDISQILVASNFGFAADFTDGATIDGITVEIDRRSIIANSGKDFRVQLATGTAFANLVGTNKAVPATIWPTTSTIATYGGVADTWTAGLTATQVRAAGFAVFLSCQANIANADVGVDFVRVTITYTAAPAGQTVSPGILGGHSQFSPTVTPGNVNISPALLGGGSTHAPTINQGAAVPLVGGHTQFSPTVQPGSVSVAPDLLGGASQFSPTIEPGAVSVSPDVLGGGTVHEPAISLPVGQTVEPPQIGGGAGLPLLLAPGIAEIFEPTITIAALSVAPPVLGGGSLFAPSITGGVELLIPGGGAYLIGLPPEDQTVQPTRLGRSRVFAPIVTAHESEDWVIDIDLLVLTEA